MRETAKRTTAECVKCGRTQHRDSLRYSDAGGGMICRNTEACAAALTDRLKRKSAGSYESAGGWKVYSQSRRRGRNSRRIAWVVEAPDGKRRGETDTFAEAEKKWKNETRADAPTEGAK